MANNIGQMVVKIVGDSSELNKALDTSEKRMDSFGNVVKNLVGAAGLGLLSSKIIGVGRAAVASSAQMESLQASFETMLGNTEKATKLMNDLKNLAAKTPFEVTGLAQASKTLLQFGVASNDILPTLRMLGDASSGNEAKFSSMALVFGQITSMGKLMGQDLLQLINAGFNPLKEISDRTGESMASLKDKMSKGAISAEMVAESFKRATSEGGKFYNGMDIASRTFEGLSSTLRDDIGALGRSFVEDLMPVLKDIIKSLSATAQFFTGLSKETKQTITIVAALAASLGPLALGIVGLSSAFGVLKAATIALNTALLANPIIATGAAVAAGIIAITAAALAFNNAMNQAKANQKILDDIFAGTSKLSAAEQISALNDELVRLNKEVAKGNGGNDPITVALQKQVDTLIKKKLQIENIGIYTEARAEKEIEENKKIMAQMAEKEKKDKAWIDNRKVVLDILENEKTEYQKLEEQIIKLNETPWAKGQLEEDRLKAIQALRDKQAIILKSMTENKEAITNSLMASEAEYEQRIARTQEDELYKVLTLSDAKKEAATNSLIASEEEYAQRTALQEDYLNNAIELAEAEKAIQAARIAKFKEFVVQAKDAFVGLYNSLGALALKVYTDDLDAKQENIDKGLDTAIKALDEETKIKLKSAKVLNQSSIDSAKIVMDAAKERLNVTVRNIDAELKALAKAKDKRLELLAEEREQKLEILDEEEQARLFAEGLAGPATEEQYAIAIAQAEDAGETEEALTLEKELRKLQIQEEYAAKREAALADELAARKIVEDEEAARVAALEAQRAKDEQLKRDNQLKYDQAQEAYEKAKVLAEERRSREKIIIEENAEKQKLAIQKQFARESYEVSKKQFDIQKAASIAATTIAGVEAAMMAYKSLAFFPPAAAAAAAVVAGLVAYQISQIAAQQHPPPNFAEGGIVMPTQGGTLANVAEAGQPEVIFPLDKLQSFISNGTTDANKNGGMINLTVMLDSKPFLEKIFPATRNKTVLISAGAIV